MPAYWHIGGMCDRLVETIEMSNQSWLSVTVRQCVAVCRSVSQCAAVTAVSVRRKKGTDSDSNCTINVPLQ